MVVNSRLIKVRLQTERKLKQPLQKQRVAYALETEQELINGLGLTFGLYHSNQTNF